MANFDDVTDALLDGIQKLSNDAQNTSSSNALRYASAANQLAEAFAWLNNPSQPHGGGTLSAD